jgi:pimeloyl-ACP methyl ester carboxylesterase
MVHPDYVWHDFAQIWQAPGRGEEYFERLNATAVQDAARAYELFGVPYEEAVRMAGWMDEVMARSVLDLYRSATPNLHADWGGDLGVTRARGLVLHPTDDSFSDAARSREVADMLGAAFRTLEGVGHWWPLQEPAQGAQALMEFWRSL